MQKPKPGYKLVKSLFGKYEEIPEEWEYAELKGLTVFGNQGVNTAIDHVEYVDNGIPMLKAGDINPSFSLETTDKISLKSFQNIPENQKPKKMDKTHISSGWIAFTKTR